MKIKGYYIFLLCIVLISCGKTTKKHKIFGDALGTTYSVNYYATSQKNLKPKFDSIFQVINQSLSTYQPDSDISKLNNGQDIKMDDHFRKVFETSKVIHKKTDGYFDPSIGILVNAYGFGPQKYNLDLTISTIDSLMNFVNFNSFKINNDNEVETDLNSFYLDFNAIAKGYTVDVISDFLKDNKITDYFVEIGGEVVASGQDHENQKIWNFGIETPQENNKSRNLSYAITLNNKALATSGNYRKFKVDSLSGQRFVHTINAKNGLAKKSDVLSASVVAVNCMEADAYATAFMAMGFSKAKQIIDSNKMSALLIYVDSENKLQTFISQDLKALTTEL